jgi:hypothetical protein
MLRKITLLAMMLVFAFGVAAIAGCGDDEEPAGGGTNSSESSGSGSSEDSGGNVDPDSPEAKAIVEQCNSTIDQLGATLSEDVKSDLKEICDEAASGDVDDVKKAAEEVCTKIVEETIKDLPEEQAAQAKEQALASCEQIGG